MPLGAEGKLSGSSYANFPITEPATPRRRGGGDTELVEEGPGSGPEALKGEAGIHNDGSLCGILVQTSKPLPVATALSFLGNRDIMLLK